MSTSALRMIGPAVIVITLCAGCRRGDTPSPTLVPDKAAPAPAARQRADIASVMANEVHGTDAQPSRASAAPGYQDAAARLVQWLREAYPDTEFSVAWNPERLRVIAKGEPSGAEGTSSLSFVVRPGTPSEAVDAWLSSVVKLCMKTESPSTKELWITLWTDYGPPQGRKESDKRGSWAACQELVAHRAGRPEPWELRGLPVDFQDVAPEYEEAASRLLGRLDRAFPTGSQSPGIQTGSM